jgi:sugar phosphate isomerase/epimerase
VNRPDDSVTRPPGAGARPQIAFGSWAFAFGPFADAPWSFDRLCRYAAAAGYDGVEINGFRPHPHDEDYDSDRRCAGLAAWLADLGLGISGYAPDFTAVPPAEVSIEDYLRRLDSVLAFCRRMGITVLRTDTVSPPVTHDAGTHAERFARLVRAWREAARRCADAGVTLVWEFEPGYWLNRPSQVVGLLAEVGHPSFRVLFDTSHAYTGAVAGARQGADPEVLTGGAVEYARLLAPWLGHLHLIDSDGSLHDDETSAHLPFGTGRVDFEAVLAALGPGAERLGWWTVDFCFCPTTERDAVTAVPYVHRLVRRVASGPAPARAAA